MPVARSDIAKSLEEFTAHKQLASPPGTAALHPSWNPGGAFLAPRPPRAFYPVARTVAQLGPSSGTRVRERGSSRRAGPHQPGQRCPRRWRVGHVRPSLLCRWRRASKCLSSFLEASVSWTKGSTHRAGSSAAGRSGTRSLCLRALGRRAIRGARKRWRELRAAESSRLMSAAIRSPGRAPSPLGPQSSDAVDALRDRQSTGRCRTRHRNQFLQRWPVRRGTDREHSEADAQDWTLLVRDDGSAMARSRSSTQWRNGTHG